MRAKSNISIYIIILLSISINAAGNGPILRRICKSQTDNTLYFTPNNDTCSKFINYYIWGKDAIGNPFVLIDSISNKGASTYLHSGANPISNPKKWTYFIAYTDSCLYPNYGFSDTVNVDETLPDSITFDSVSVDINTNQVILGWKHNTSPDFYHYLLFKDSLSNLLLISPPELQDTFFRDLSGWSNPSVRSLTYDISSMDSCLLTQRFGYNPHSTMFLSGGLDTCLSKINISWTPYIGWPSIRSYYIYVSKSGGGYILIDSISPSQKSYTFSITLGINYTVFVRSFKLDTQIISSSSNTVSFSSNARTDPAHSYLANVSAINPDGSDLEITLLTNPGEEYLSALPYHSDESSFPTFIPLNPINITSNSGYFTHHVNRDLVQYYKYSGLNLCALTTDTSNTSNNIKIAVLSEGSSNRILWNKYYGWDNGVNKYRIYRGTNLTGNVVNYSLLDSVLSSDSSYIDQNPITEIGNLGICYYVESIQNPSAPHGISYTSKSFSSCITGDLTVFIPNAFCPYGFNKIFKPEGLYIDLEKSTMEIYDRWGGLIKSFENLVNGWDGKSSSGIALESGVYLYRMTIVSTNGHTKQKQGTVTLLH